MKKNTYFYIIIFILLINLPTISIDASTIDTVITSIKFRKKVEKGDTLLVIDYELEKSEKIKLIKVALVGKPKGEENEITIPLKLDAFKNKKVVGTGLGEVIKVDLSKQVPIKKARYIAQITYAKEPAKKKEKSPIIPKEPAPPKNKEYLGTGISFLQRVTPVWGHKEINHIMVSKKEKVKKTGKIAPWLLPIVASVSLLSAGYHYSEAKFATKQRDEAKHIRHINKTNQHLLVSGISYALDLAWVTIRNKNQKKIKK